MSPPDNDERPRGRLPPGGTWRLVAAGLIALVGVGLATYSYSLRPEAVNDSARTAVTVVGAVILVLCVGGAYAIARTVFPPAAKHLRVTVASDEVTRGSDVVVTLEISRPERAAASLELGLQCKVYYDERRSDGRGGHTRAKAEAVAHEDWRPQAATPTQTVRFPVPPDAPFSYRGDCLSFDWRVAAREPRRLRFDRAATVPVSVRP